MPDEKGQGETPQAKNRKLLRELMFYRSIVTCTLEDAYPDDEDRLEVQIEKDFFDKIYMDRPALQDIIKRWVASPGSGLARVVGVQGSGKSMLIRRVKQSLDNQRCPMIVLDISRVFDQFEDQPPEKWKSYIDKFLKGIFCSTYIKSEHMVSLYSYVLWDSTDQADENLFDVRESLNALYRQYQSAPRTSPDQVDKNTWFCNNADRDDEVRGILKGLCDRLTLHDYVRGAVHLHRGDIRKFVIVFDNVDRILRRHQPALYQIAQDFRTIHGAYVKVIIATRRETAHPPDDTYWGSDPQTILEIGAYEPTQEYKAELSHEEFKNLLTLRDVYYALQPRDETLKEQLIHLSYRIKDQYSEVMLINLANQSIRDALRYHCDFMGYLLKEYQYEDLAKRIDENAAAPEAPGAFLMSCLLGWLTKHEQILEQQCLNPVALAKRCRAKIYRNIRGCDLSYLLLVCLQNYRKDHGHNPKVSNLIEEFRPLHYEEREIKETLFNLYLLRFEEFGYTVSLYQKDIPTSPTGISLDAEVELNHRGEALVNRVCVSFTYISKLLFDSGDDHCYSTEDKSKIVRYYDLENMKIHLKHNTRFLADLAFLHTLELYKIRTAYNCGDWLARFREHFGVRKRLQIERIVASNTAFMRKTVSRMEEDDETRKEIERGLQFMEKIGDLYTQQVKGFTNGTKVLNYANILEAMQGDSTLLDWTFERFQKPKDGEESPYLRDLDNLLERAVAKV